MGGRSPLSPCWGLRGRLCESSFNCRTINQFSLVEICLAMLALQAEDKIKTILYLVMQRAQLIKLRDKQMAKANIVL